MIRRLKMKKSTIFFVLAGTTTINAISHFMFKTQLTLLHETTLYAMSITGLVVVGIKNFEEGN